MKHSGARAYDWMQTLMRIPGLTGAWASRATEYRGRFWPRDSISESKRSQHHHEALL